MKRPLRHQLDRILRERLEGLQPPYDPAHWDQLEERLDSGALEEEALAGRPEMDNQDLDAVWFEKMHAYQPAYQPSHWAKMERELRRVFDWPAYVLRYKALEATLVLLLFMGLWQHFPLLQKPADVQAFHIPLLPNGQQASAIAGKTLSTAASGAQVADEARGQKAAGKKQQTSESGDVPPPSFGQAAPQEASRYRPGSGLAALPKRAQRAITDKTVGETAYTSLEFTATSRGPVEAATVAPIPSRGITALSFSTASLNEVQTASPKKGPILRLAMFGSGEYNHILVPASEDRRLSESFERAAFGYGSGLSLGIDFGRVELETGLVYAARHYPVGLVYLQGSVAQGFQGDELRTTELNIVNLPVHVRYDVVQKGKWRGYFLGGGAVQVAFQTNYFTADAPPQFNFQPAMPIISDGGNSSEENAIDRIRQDGVGWFEGGSFKDNAYFTANLGFGVERFISGRWSLFAQPVYQYSFHYFKNINGLGPNNDRINSMSVLFGTRVRIK